MMLGSRMEETLSPVSPVSFALPTSTRTGPERVGLAGPWSGSSPLTPLVTPGSPHFLMALSYPAIKARDQTARPREWEIIGRTRRTCGSRGTVRPLARKLLMLLFTETNSGKQDSKLQSFVVEHPVLEDLYRQKALVSINKASVTIYWLAEEQHKIASMALADSLGLGVSHADRKLCRLKTQGKPWGFLKTHCSEHLLHL